jgi:hypothetical protein
VRIVDDEQVVGLEVAVNDALGVRRTQRGRRLIREVHGGRDGQRPVAPQPRSQALTFEQLHHQERRPVGERAGVEDLDDVRVSDRVGRARFVQEARQQVLVAAVVLVQDLDRHAAADPRVLGEIDGAHPTLAQQRNRAVITELFADHRGPMVPDGARRGVIFWTLRRRRSACGAGIPCARG